MKKADEFIFLDKANFYYFTYSDVYLGIQGCFYLSGSIMTHCNI